MFCPSLTGMGVHNLRGKDDLGSVLQPKGTAIIKRQFQAGYVLLCVARPKEGCIFEVGVESHSTLYQNPFSTPLRSLYLKRPKQRQRRDDHSCANLQSENIVLFKRTVNDILLGCLGVELQSVAAAYTGLCWQFVRGWTEHAYLSCGLVLSSARSLRI